MSGAVPGQQRGGVIDQLIVYFPGARHAASADVGGKAASLIRMSEAGLPVPAGAVVTTAFFAPWFEEVKASTTWAALRSVSPADWAPLCAELKRRALALRMTEWQQDALHTLLRNLEAFPYRQRLCRALVLT